MGGAVLCLIVLVVLPLLSLLLGSVRGEQRPEPRAISSEVRQRPALCQRAEELADPRRLDRAVQPDHRRAARLGGEPHRRAGQGADPAHREPLLSVAAVPHRHRLRLSVQPECRPDQRADARRARPAVAHLQHLLDDRAGAGHGAAHLPVRLSAGLERAAVGRRLLRGGRADPRREQAAHRVHRSRRRWSRRRSCPARCSPSSTPSRCSARRRSSACPAGS